MKSTKILDILPVSAVYWILAGAVCVMLKLRMPKAHRRNWPPDWKPIKTNNQKPSRRQHLINRRLLSA